MVSDSAWFPSISQLEFCEDGVFMKPHRRDAVDVAVRASTRRVREPRPCRDRVGHAGVPQIVLEFDVTNSYLLTAQITYNRREANNKILAFNSRDLQQRLIDEFNDMKIWDAAGAYLRVLRLRGAFARCKCFVSENDGAGWFFSRF